MVAPTLISQNGGGFCVHYLYPGGDGLLHVGVCYEMLISYLHLKRSKEMEIIGCHSAKQAFDCSWEVMENAGATSKF